MKYNLLLFVAEAIIEKFWESQRVKEFVLKLLNKYAQSTDNDVDNIIVEVVRSKLFTLNHK
jgi:hypothetical protein